MTDSNMFQPNWASPPGDTISDLLKERALSPDTFSQLIELHLDLTKELIQGNVSISIGIARKLEEVLGPSVEFWMNRDLRFRQSVAKCKEEEKTWLKGLPIAEMLKFGWLSPRPHPKDELTACLQFFGLPNVAAWHKQYANVETLFAFRTSNAYDSRPGAVAAWLRQGEIEADRIRCKPWNATEFSKSLKAIRSLTRSKDPNHFIGELQGICSLHGVAVVVLRAPNGCRASGATRFITKSKALLLLSFRYLSDDQFWFSFFHEAAHLILHGDRGLVFEFDNVPLSVMEVEANDYAAECLIPTKYREELLRLSCDIKSILRFAKNIGVSPGVVVGQLQHLGRIKHSQFNKLKVRFEWG